MKMVVETAKKLFLPCLFFFLPWLINFLHCILTPTNCSQSILLVKKIWVEPGSAQPRGHTRVGVREKNN